MTPHQTVLLEEAVEALRIRPDGIYVDATFGRGGHSRAILQRLGKDGKLVAFDRDPEAVTHAQAIEDPRFAVVHAGFGGLKDVLLERGVEHVDGVLFDLGVSSPQIDEAQRGFSFRFDGPLDMRMDTSRGQTAAQWLDSASELEIGGVIRRYGEDRFAKQIARAIVAARSGGPVDRTRQLAQIVAKAVPAREPRQDPATRTFQALRIHINKELEELEVALPRSVEMLADGARLVVISFHSLEDRIVKQFMRAESQPAAVPRRLPLRAAEMPRSRMKLVGKAIRATDAEVQANPRSRSAIMRVAERLAA
ncbi:MAG: 16S rRNA (cytosine(1402)-N(4))-methyltransferase RsmH [Betaproteobacteria bacterium]